MTRKVNIYLPYGSHKLDAELREDNLLCVLSPKDLPSTPNDRDEIVRSLSHPIASEKIEKLARGCNSAVIVSDDYTRVTPSRLILPFILNELDKAKIRDDQIEIVVALGTHRPMTEEEMIGKFGERVAERIQVKNHDFRDLGCLVDVGYTIGEKPIFVNKEVYEAELKLAVGNIVPHHACGWAGGAKMVLPGISGEETIGSMHLLSARSRTSYLGILENPIRQIMEEAARAISFNTVFNTVLNRRGQIVKAFCGDIAYAFREGVNTAERCYRVEVPALADIVLASSYPYDKDFWQAHKALYPAEMAVKANGTIVLVTPCYEGVSKTHKELYNIARLKPKEIELQLQTGQVKDKAGAALCLVWSQIRKKAKIILVSEGISPKEAKMIGFEHCKSVAEALEMGFQKHGRKATVTILKRADIAPQVVENRDRVNGIS